LILVEPKSLGTTLIPLGRGLGGGFYYILHLPSLRAFAPPSPKESFGPKGDMNDPASIVNSQFSIEPKSSLDS